MAKNMMRLIKTYDEFRRDSEREHGGGSKQAHRQGGSSEQAPERPAFPRPSTGAGPVRPASAQSTSAGAAPSPAPTAPAAALPHDVPARPPAPATPATRPPSRPTDSAATLLDAEALYERTLDGVARMFEAAVMESITPGRLATAVARVEELCPAIVRSTASGRGLLRKAMGTYAEGEGFVLPHSVNVAVLAVELGLELELPADGIPDLCLAGLVHDLGSVRLRQGLLTKSESLTPSEWDEMRTRPRQTRDMLAAIGERYQGVAEIAYQVYERLDGSGYPGGLQGDEILPEARILGTVDFFESFAHPRPYKTTLPGTASHGIQMLMQMADKFGASTLKALVGSIGLFPIGSYVRLSSGEIGRVVDVKRENPMRPEVEVLLDSRRRAPDVSRTLDLLAIPHVYVSRALTASDLRELGMMPAPCKVPSLAGSGSGLS